MQLCFVVPPQWQGSTLKSFLAYCGVSASLVRSVKQKVGGFLQNKQPIRTCDTVQAGSTISFCLPQEAQTSVVPQDLPIGIVYEDAHAIVLEKPAGMAVHPTLNYANGTLANTYLGLLQKRQQQGVFRPLNRLDCNTSGLVLCAKNAYAAHALLQTVQKEYTAILQGHLPHKKGEITAPIARAQGSIILRCVRQDGKQSCTQYTVAKQAKSASLVTAIPQTGRTHQLRVHFSFVGCPLMGDDLYGGSRDAIARHALHCSKISFTMPQTGKHICIESPLPQDMAALWRQQTQAQYATPRLAKQGHTP